MERIHLGHDCYAQVSCFEGHVGIDTRKYYLKDGELAPTQKGIFLSIEQFEALLAGAGDVLQLMGQE